MLLLRYGVKLHGFETMKSNQKDGPYQEEACKLLVVQQKLSVNTDKENNTLFTQRYLKNQGQKTPLVIPEKTSLQNFRFDKDLVNAELKECTFLNCNFRRIPFFDINIQKSTLCVVDLGETFAKNLIANDANLFFVNFAHSDLENASFQNATLEFVSFIGANLANVNFSQVKSVKGVVLIGAHTNSNTKMPPNGALLKLKDLEEQINENRYTLDELRFLKIGFEQSEQKMRLDINSTIRPKYLTVGHIDEVVTAKHLLENAIKQHSNKNKK